MAPPNANQRASSFSRANGKFRVSPKSPARQAFRFRADGDRSCVERRSARQRLRWLAAEDGRLETQEKPRESSANASPSRGSLRSVLPLHVVGPGRSRFLRPSVRDLGCPGWMWRFASEEPTLPSSARPKPGALNPVRPASRQRTAVHRWPEGLSSGCPSGRGRLGLANLREGSSQRQARGLVRFRGLREVLPFWANRELHCCGSRHTTAV
jgi:hypothetical protein